MHTFRLVEELHTNVTPILPYRAINGTKLLVNRKSRIPPLKKPGVFGLTLFSTLSFK